MGISDSYACHERVYTEKQASARAAYWQAKLRLTDWAISVSIVRAHVLCPAGDLLLGDVAVLPTKQIAVIRLLDHIDFISDVGYIPFHDMELTLIHELLHVRLHGMADDAKAVRDLSEERAVHMLSMALSEVDVDGTL